MSATRWTVLALAALGILGLAACDDLLADPTVGNTYDPCVDPPAGYTVTPPGASAGASCDYALDCVSGLCLPEFDDAAYCSQPAVTDCAEGERARIVPLHLEVVVGDDTVPTTCSEAWTSLCVRSTADFVCGESGCPVGEPCAGNADCASTFCAMRLGQEVGICVDPCIDESNCDSANVCQALVSDVGDPQFICVPNSL